MTKAVIFDLESDGLLDAITKVHSLQIGDLDGDDAVVYADWPGCPTIKSGLQRLREADRVIGQNLISYDFPVMEMFFPGVLRREQIVDTLVLARLALPEERSHSLETWGQRLGVLKGSFKGPWDTLTQEMVDYAAQDVVVTRAMYNEVKHVLGWGEAAQLEHDVAWALQAMEANGFPFDVAAAQELDATLRGELAATERGLQAAFPPLKRTRRFTPLVNNSKLGYRKGVEVVKEWHEAFAPSSRHHVAERLQLLGWKPKADAFGANGIPTVDEKTLAGLPFPEVKPILRYFEVSKLLAMLSDGKNGWLKLVGSDGRIHGRVNGNGACTGRMSHSKPNMAQVPTDKRARSLFKPRAGWRLVGCDAEGLEARVLAHFLARWDNGMFADRLLNGKKEDGSDIHSANLAACKPVGLVSRDGSKTLLYARLYGAGDWKLGETIKQDCRNNGAKPPKVPSKELGILTRRALSKSMRGLDKLTEAAAARAKERGYLVGLDGREVHIRSSHAALNTLCQGAGAVLMKKALQLFMRDFGNLHGAEFALTGQIHDEAQLEAVPERAEEFGRAYADCIRRAGEHFNLRCPLAGAYAVGLSWAETH